MPEELYWGFLKKEGCRLFVADVSVITKLPSRIAASRHFSLLVISQQSTKLVPAIEETSRGRTLLAVHQLDIIRPGDLPRMIH
jgi:hypothetical protein